MGRPLSERRLQREVQEQAKRQARVVDILPTQEDFITDTTAYSLLQGGAGSGKTIGGALKALKMVVEHPGIVGIITAPSYKMLQDATIPAYEKVFTRSILKKVNKTDMRAETTNGGKLFFRTTSEPYLLRGPTVGFFHMDEGSESPALAFKILQARLRQEGTPQQGWVTTTPKGFNWLHHEFIKEERDNYRVFRARTIDNYLLPPDYVTKLRESYQDDEQFLAQELEGEFIEIGRNCPFDMRILNEMFNDVYEKKPLRIEEWINVYTDRSIGKKYIISADAATGKGEDDSAFVVAMVTPAVVEIVCCGRKKLSEAEFAEILDKKGRDYGEALNIVEAAPVGKATIGKLEELHYPKLYKTKRKSGDDVVGWTGMKLKAMMVAELSEAIKDRTLIIPDMDIIEQLMSYIQDEKGNYGAAGRARDDYVSALMLLIQGIKEMPMIMGRLPVIKMRGTPSPMTYSRT